MDCDIKGKQGLISKQYKREPGRASNMILSIHTPSNPTGTHNRSVSHTHLSATRKAPHERYHLVSPAALLEW